MTKSGNGSWALSGANSYTGTTTVVDGTLVLQGGYCLPDTGALLIDSDTDGNGKVELYANEKVGALELGGVPQATGTYGSTASNAENQNDTYFSGTKALYVGVDLPPSGTAVMMQ